ncbi:MAG: biopolymer transporter ExbD [Deltaproteobacteria bacterium]|nr:biopolymer transporter ExbD [Deltaproteobacteria bacterium]
MQAGASGGGFQAQINVTPLVDIVMVLLIIFMVVTPMMQKAKAVQLPEAKHVVKGKGEREQLFVIVTADGELWLDQDPVMKEGLVEAVKDRLSFNPGIEVVVKGDRSLDYGKVRAVMLDCRKAGAARVVIATKERKEEDA